MAHDFKIEVKNGKKIMKTTEEIYGCDIEEFNRSFLKCDKYIIESMLGRSEIPLKNVSKIEQRGTNTYFSYNYETTDDDCIAYFFGYAGGIMYDAFNCQWCNNGISGSGESIELSHDRAMRGLEKAISQFDACDYSDHKRMDDIKRFYRRFKDDCSDQKYIIQFN